MSDAEKSYVAPQATTRVSEAPRKIFLSPVIGKKFSATENNQGEVTITNPYMNPDAMFFTKAAGLVCTADGGLIVAGNAGLDPRGYVLATGYWTTSPVGAVTPLYTRSARAYAKSHGAKCDAPYGKVMPDPAPFARAPGGTLLKAVDYALTRIEADGYVSRVAGAPYACEEDGTPSKVRGLVDGARDTARFDRITELAVDSRGTAWIADQNGCSLRKVTSDGQVTTVIPPDVGCSTAGAPEDRLGLEHLTWDEAHGELVSVHDFPVARPVHDWYTTIWRIKPTGEFRRVSFTTKGGHGPTKTAVDGIQSSIAVDPQGRIHYGTRLMKNSSILLIVRLDAATGAVVPVTGGKFAAGEDTERKPRDGPAGRAYFNHIEGMCFSPDGTLFALDEHLVRKLEKTGTISTWLF
ncbi:MAG TPA: hypothetical protein VF147_06085 [Vicinamibacterales bacterium]